MYVVRWVAKAKRGHVQDVINYFKGLRDNNPNLDGKVVRIYANIFGENDIVCSEVEFADMESAAKFVDFTESDEAQAQRLEGDWYDMTTGLVLQMWKVID
jgi:hypothetical protein